MEPQQTIGWRVPPSKGACLHRFFASWSVKNAGAEWSAGILPTRSAGGTPRWAERKRCEQSTHTQRNGRSGVRCPTNAENALSFWVCVLPIFVPSLATCCSFRATHNKKQRTTFGKQSDRVPSTCVLCCIPTKIAWIGQNLAFEQSDAQRWLARCKQTKCCNAHFWCTFPPHTWTPCSHPSDQFELQTCSLCALLLFVVGRCRRFCLLCAAQFAPCGTHLNPSAQHGCTFCVTTWHFQRATLS